MNEFDLLMAELKALIGRTILAIEKAEMEENILAMNRGLEVLAQAKMKLEEINALMKKEPGKIKRFLARVAAGMN